MASSAHQAKNKIHTQLLTNLKSKAVMLKQVSASLLAMATIFILTTIFTTMNAEAKEIKVDFHQVPQQARTDFYKATDIIEQCIDIQVPIKIKVMWSTQGPTGFAVYRPTKNQPDFFIKNAWYPAALAHQLRGLRDSTLDDMNLFFAANTDWYFNNSTSPIKPTQTDFINVALHEILHGLGLSSATFIETNVDSKMVANAENNTQQQANNKSPIGNIGLPNEYINFFNYSFGKLELDGTPTLYDTFIRTEKGDTLFGFKNPSVELAKQLQSNNYFHGPNAQKANLGQSVQLSAGDLSHIQQPRKASAHPIMTTEGGKGKSNHQLDPIAIGMLKDLGWKIKPSCPATL